MTLPQVNLDDRRFQELVNEARQRISQACPEWTEHNVSDPGITLIEQFAWIADMLLYRLNRIPDKLHVALLDLLDIRLHGPTSARTELRFRLAAPPERPLEIPAGSTEVGTLRTAAEESVVFQVSEGYTIEPLVPSAYAIKRGNEVKLIPVGDGSARPQGTDRLPFGRPPQPDDALLLGFDADIARLVMRVEIDGSMARGAGVDPEDPPLLWEVSQGDNRWTEAVVLVDRTGGFNYGPGMIEVQCPSSSAATAIGGRRLRWLRCRITAATRSGKTGVLYTNPPEIYSITAGPAGALLGAEHSSREGAEPLGTSDGTPGQTFTLRFAPVLPLEGDETLEVRDPTSGRWADWQATETFAESASTDRHFRLDTNSGEIELGPAVRQPHGGWTQYGAVPPQGAELRMTSYRHGGGREGNVTAGSLTMLRSSIPGVASVVNPRAAYGGVDPESLDAARQRAALEIRTRYRAVTAEDYEFLALQASSRVGRTVCVSPTGPGEPIRLHLLPQTVPADRQLTADELIPDGALLGDVAEYLEGRRVIGTIVHLLPVRLRGISVVVKLQAEPQTGLERIEQEVLQALYTYLNPLVGGSASGPSTGWPFGRLLNQGELYQIVHSVEGVQFVEVLRVYETDLASGKQSPNPAGSHVVLEPDELIASGTHIVKAVHAEAV